MKNLFKNLMLVAVAAMGFTACEQVIDDVNAGIDENTVTMTFVAEAPESRTSVAIDGDVAKYSWSTGDKVGFYYVDVEATSKKKQVSKEAVISGSTATFDAEFDKITGASAYNIGAFYPSGSWVSHIDTNPFNNVKVKIAAGQALTAGTFDPAADLMMSKPFMGVALSNDTVFALEFSRIAAIGKMNLKLDGMEEGEIINKVRFSFAEGTHFNGPVSLDLENGDYTLATEGTSNYVELSGELAANADRTAIYFTCFPGEYEGDYTIEVTTDKATYSKTATLSKALSFSAGDVLNFNATVGNRDVKEEEKVVYTLVTNVANLAVGDKVVIVAKDYTAAMSTAQNDNNRGVVTVTKSGNTIAYVDEPQILTLEAGKTSGTFAFNTGSGYLYAASSSKNYLRTETTLSANSSWSIEITDAGVATIKAQGTNTHNWMRYNQSSSIFSCYSSGQMDICIYKGVEADTDGLTAQTLSFPQSVYTITMGDTFAAPTVSGAQTTVTYTSSNTDVATVNANSGAVTVEGTGTTTITASAIEANGYRAAEASYTLTVNPVGGGAKTYTLQFGATYNSKGQSSYSNSWYVTCNEFIWDIVNANNNNNGWSYIKIGSKNAAYVGKITTRDVMPETIKTVTMSVSAITAADINSIKLYVATDSAFSEDVQTISVTPAVGDLTFTIPTPTPNCFYKIEVDCKKAASNGPISIKKVVYTNE